LNFETASSTARECCRTFSARLVDHYFAAWQETSLLLLQRRARELAESRRDAKVRVVSIAP
jgi:hypothetical protein